MSTEARGQFTFYRSFYEALCSLPKKDREPVIMAMCAYGLDGVDTELKGTQKVVFSLMKPTLESGRKKARSGKAGGMQNAGICQANRKQRGRETEAEPEREDEIETEIELEAEAEGSRTLSAAAADKKLRFMQGELGRGVVMLTDEQVDSLLDRLGLDGFDYYVDKLSSFILKNGARVKNHYATILRWYLEDTETGGAL